MGFNLSNHVLDNAPDDLTPAERLVLSVLAGYVHDEAKRECFPGLDKLVKRTGLKPDSLRKVFQRLAARGLDPRVPIGTDRNGRKVFAHESQRTTYRIPVFESRDEHPATEEGSASRHSTPRGGTTVPKRRDRGPLEEGSASRPEEVEEVEDSLSSRLPHQTRDSPATPGDEREIDPLVQKLIGDHGVTEDEAAALLVQVRAEGKLGNLAGWACSAAGRLDIKQRLYALRYSRDTPIIAPGRSLPPWCGECGDRDPAAATDPARRFHHLDDGSSKRCDCHPASQKAA